MKTWLAELTSFFATQKKNHCVFIAGDILVSLYPLIFYAKSVLCAVFR